MSNIYMTGTGYDLFRERTFSRGIKKFIDIQENILREFCEKNTVMVEVGCGKAEHLTFCLDSGISYFGIDPIMEYVREGQERCREARSEAICQVVHGNAERLVSIMEENRISFSRALIFYPFNSIGNMNSLEDVLRELALSTSSYFISTYGTSANATAERMAYYANCGFEGLTVERDERGVVCSSDEGFRSAAFDDEYFMAVCRKTGLSPSMREFAEIGVGYFGAGGP
jgi:hypothetical protein